MHSNGKKWRGTKELLDESKKLNFQKTEVMASSPITSWQIDGETGEAVADFIFLAPKALWTAATKLKDTCSVEEKIWQT